MSEFYDTDVQQIAVQIERYLQSHPNAADTAEGIARWWLPGQGIQVSPLIVQQALDYLGSKSVVKCNANPCGNKVYSNHKASNVHEIT
jgi:hypothetical protein